MSDAIQVIVRGFETQTVGQLIVDKLTDYGWDVPEMFDGEHDSMGGLIETNIADVNQLEVTDRDELLEALFRDLPTINLVGLKYQLREFQEIN